MKMLERMCSAAWPFLWEAADTTTHAHDEARARLRAALEAMREPGREVMTAMDAESYPDSGSYTRWQAGIDEILGGEA